MCLLSSYSADIEYTVNKGYATHFIQWWMQAKKNNAQKYNCDKYYEGKRRRKKELPKNGMRIANLHWGGGQRGLL